MMTGVALYPAGGPVDDPTLPWLAMCAATVGGLLALGFFTALVSGVAWLCTVGACAVG